MRRPTLNPNSSLKSSNARPSLSITNTTMRRDVRTLRDRDFFNAAIALIDSFLSQNNYARTDKLLQNPSAKDVQNLFKFIISFVYDNYPFSSRFEDDVLSVLKLLKYPFLSEINRSMFVAVTPHSWPVIAAMFSFLVECVMASGIESRSQQSVNALFNEHATICYLSFMRGDEDIPDEVFEAKIFNLYSDVYLEIEDRVKILKEIETKYENRNWEAEKQRKEKLHLAKKKNEEDFESLKQSLKQIQEKLKKYENKKMKCGQSFELIESELNEIKIKIQETKNVISKQKIKPEDIQIINKEKIELYNELEKLKPWRENLMKEINELEKARNSVLEENEKLLFDLKNVCVGDVPFVIIKERENIKIVSDDKFDERIKKEMAEIENIKNQKQEKVGVLSEKMHELSFQVREQTERFKSDEDNFLMLGKLYLEKKEILELEQRKGLTDLKKLEHEIMKLNLESKNSLLVCERKVEIRRVELAKVLNNIQSETEILKREMDKFGELQQFDCDILNLLRNSK